MIFNSLTNILKQISAQVNAIYPYDNDFDYWENMSLGLKMAGAIGIFLLFLAMVAGIAYIIYLKLPNLIVRISDEDRTIKCIEKGECSIVQSETYLNEYYQVKHAYTYVYKLIYITDKWEKKLNKRKKIQSIILWIYVAIIIFFHIPFLFASSLVSSKIFMIIFLAVIVVLVYNRTHNPDYKSSEKILYEEEVGKKIKHFFEGFDSNELWLKSDKEIYPLLCAEFEKNRENYKYNVIMKKHK